MKENNNESGCGAAIFFGIITLIVTLTETGNIGEAIFAGIGSVIFVYFLMRIF